MMAEGVGERMPRRGAGGDLSLELGRLLHEGARQPDPGRETGSDEERNAPFPGLKAATSIQWTQGQSGKALSTDRVSKGRGRSNSVSGRPRSSQSSASSRRSSTICRSW